MAFAGTFVTLATMVTLRVEVRTLGDAKTMRLTQEMLVRVPDLNERQDLIASICGAVIIALTSTCRKTCRYLPMRKPARAIR